MSKRDELIKRIEEFADSRSKLLESNPGSVRLEYVLVARYSLAAMEAFRVGRGGDKEAIAKSVAAREGVFPDHNGWPPRANNETNYEFRVPSRSVEPGDEFHFIGAKVFSDASACLGWLRNLPPENYFLNAATEVTFSAQLAN